MSKRLNTLILSLFLTSFSLFSQQADSVYKKVKDLEKSNLVSSQYKLNYDLNGDLFVDFSKIYDIENDSTEHLFPFPLYYIFYNTTEGRNTEIVYILIDRKKNGVDFKKIMEGELDEGEEILYKKPKRTQLTKI